MRTPLRADILSCLTIAITCVTSVKPGNPLRYAVYLVPLLYLWEWVIRHLRADFLQGRSARAYLVLIASLLCPAAISPGREGAGGETPQSGHHLGSFCRVAHRCRAGEASKSKPWTEQRDHRQGGGRAVAMTNRQVGRGNYPPPSTWPWR